MMRLVLLSSWRFSVCNYEVVMVASSSTADANVQFVRRARKQLRLGANGFRDAENDRHHAALHGSNRVSLKDHDINLDGFRSSSIFAELRLAHLLLVIVITLLFLQEDNHVVNHLDDRVHADLLALGGEGDQVKAVVDMASGAES